MEFSDDKFENLFNYLQSVSRKQKNESKMLQNIKIMEEQLDAFRNNYLKELSNLDEKYKNDEMRINSKYFELSEKNKKLQDEVDSLSKKLQDFGTRNSFDKAAIILEFENEKDWLQKCHRTEIQKLQKQIDANETTYKAKVEKLESERSIMALHVDDIETMLQKQIIDQNLKIMHLQNMNTNLRHELAKIKLQQKQQENQQKLIEFPSSQGINNFFVNMQEAQTANEVKKDSEIHSTYQRVLETLESANKNVIGEDENLVDSSFHQLADIETDNHNKTHPLPSDDANYDCFPEILPDCSNSISMKPKEDVANRNVSDRNLVPADISTNNKYKPLPIVTINANDNIKRIHRPKIYRSIKERHPEIYNINRNRDNDGLPDLVSGPDNNVNEDVTVVNNQIKNTTNTSSTIRKRKLYDPNNLEYLNNLEGIGDCEGFD